VRRWRFSNRRWYSPRGDSFVSTSTTPPDARPFTDNRPSEKIAENAAIRSAGVDRRGCFSFLR